MHQQIRGSGRVGGGMGRIFRILSGMVWKGPGSPPDYYLRSMLNYLGPRAPEYAEGAVLRVSRVASSSVATTIIEQLVWDVCVVQYNKAMAGPTETKDMHT